MGTPAPTRSLGLHLMNEAPVGVVAVTEGPAMAAADKFTIEVVGRGGHGAYPHTARDPVLAAAHVVTALQSIVARDVPPLESAVVSATSVSTPGDAFNVIPPHARLVGTIRSFTPAVRARVHERLREVAEGVARGLGCEARVVIEPGVPAVVNDAAVARRVREIAARVPGVTQVIPDRRTMGSEDMSYFLERAPGCFAFVGSAARLPAPPHHSPDFDFDERALPIGATLLAQAARDLVKAA
jgi:amidohydrolase